jgi:predicted transcriptional regulator
MPQVWTSGDCDADECVDLTSRESSVCQIICGAQEPISFTEVKDSSDLHQELVSRIVRRLVIHGLVSKVEGKYTGHCR